MKVSIGLLIVIITDEISRKKREPCTILELEVSLFRNIWQNNMKPTECCKNSRGTYDPTTFHNINVNDLLVIPNSIPC